jgi:hypothetical protein
MGRLWVVIGDNPLQRSTGMAADKRILVLASSFECCDGVAFGWSDLAKSFGRARAEEIRVVGQQLDKLRNDRKVYKHRNQIERFFGRIKRCRRIATRYEKKAANFAGFIWLAALITDMI